MLATGSLALTASPAAAKDIYAFFGPLEIRIIGAGDVRDFVAMSPEDRLGAAALVKQISGAMQTPAQPIEEAAATLPHYRLGVGHLAMDYVTTPWARMSETSFVYYPGGHGSSFLMVEFSPDNAALEERWIVPSPEVRAMLDRHIQGLAPIGMDSASPGAPTASWGILVGAVLLAGFTWMLFEDRRRWRVAGAKRSAGKGTDRRS